MKSEKRKAVKDEVIFSSLLHFFEIRKRAAGKRFQEKKWSDEAFFSSFQKPIRVKVGEDANREEDRLDAIISPF